MARPMTPRDAAIAVVRRLREHGHVAYLAGGCVRDLLLGREPNDYDVATDAHPPRITALFSRTLQVGAAFGVVIVRQGPHWIEVATFRADVSYTDGRHPDAVRFSSPQEDARRRDFTINGMFLDPIDDRVIDYVGGQADLATRTLRAIGEPRERFAEDHLRVLRAIRFAATYECTIDPATWTAVCDMAPMLHGVSAERIREELERCFADPHRATCLRLLDESGLLHHLWPDASWTPPQIAAARARVEHLPASAGFELTLAALLVDRPPADVQRVTRALTCSNDARNHVAWLVEHADALAQPTQLTLADLKQLMETGRLDDLLALFAARCRAEGRPLDAHDDVQARAAAIAPQDVAPSPFVTGDDLLAMKLPEGPAYSRILDRVYYLQRNDELRSRDEALALTRRLVDDAMRA